MTSSPPRTGSTSPSSIGSVVLQATRGAAMAQYRFTVDIAAPVEQVFDLWTNVERWHEWIEGLGKVTDVTGPPDQAGTRYTTWFGSMRSPSEILEAERPR